MQGIGSQVEILKGSLADEQQGVAVRKAHPGAGLLPKTIGCLPEPEQAHRLPRHPAQPLIGVGPGVQGGKAIPPDTGVLRGATERRLHEGKGGQTRIAQLQPPLDGGGHHLLQLGMGAGGDKGAIRFDHHVAAIPGKSLLGYPGALQRHACRRFDGVEMYAGEGRHVLVLVLWGFL